MTNQDRLEEEFENELKRLIGKPCLSIYAGESTGPDVLIDFGKKMPRTIPVLNPKLTEEERYYEGEVSLFIRCAWRVDTKREVICGSTDSAVEDGPMITGLGVLLQRTVESIQVRLPGLDLTVKFNGSLELRIFCDQTDLENEYDNYSFTLKKNKIYIVGPRGRLRYELPNKERSA